MIIMFDYNQISQNLCEIYFIRLPNAIETNHPIEFDCIRLIRMFDFVRLTTPGYIG